MQLRVLKKFNTLQISRMVPAEYPISSAALPSDVPLSENTVKNICYLFLPGEQFNEM